MKADTEQRLYNVYTADCLGMLLRNLCGMSEFNLYSDFIYSEEEKPKETTEQVIDKILRLLSGAGKGVIVRDGSI